MAGGGGVRVGVMLRQGRAVAVRCETLARVHIHKHLAHTSQTPAPRLPPLSPTWMACSTVMWYRLRSLPGRVLRCMARASPRASVSAAPSLPAAASYTEPSGGRRLPTLVSQHSSSVLRGVRQVLCQEREAGTVSGKRGPKAQSVNSASEPGLPQMLCAGTWRHLHGNTAICIRHTV
jgi:hypothetical protein